MKKSFMLLASIILIFLFSYGFTNEEIGNQVGDYAPNITFTSNGKTLDIEKYRGEYVLLNFWSSYDSDSRMNCNLYDSYFRSSNKENGEKSVNYLSINLDENEILFNEILRRDNLDNDSQFFAGNRNFSQIDKFYDIKAGFNSYLISKSGKIIAINPSVSELKNL